jgi:peptidoglycan/LPS O-acetylase OafA/YrhL
MGSVIHDHEHVHDMGTGPAGGTAMMGVVRLILTIAGAAAMIFGTFLEWVNGHDGIHLAFRAYYRPVFVNSAFLTSAGAAMILLGLIALVGLADSGGWLSRIAGALGIVGFVLILISMGRVVGMDLPEDIGEGLVWSVAGSIVVLIGGFVSVPWGE